MASHKYRAFLSYCHADIVWAKRLQRRLERFVVKRVRSGRLFSRGREERLGRIFRDHNDFPAGSQLIPATAEALAQSEALIVVCSRRAALSAAVEEEVRMFRHLYPGRPVIPFIVDGKAPENFPAALRCEIDADGTVSSRPVTILAPDARADAEGEQLAVAKVIATLLGVAVSEIHDHIANDDRRAARKRKVLVSSFSGLAATILFGGVYTWHAVMRNAESQSATIKTVTEAVNKAVATSERWSVPRRISLDFLDLAETALSPLTRSRNPSPQVRSRKAWMLLEFATNYSILGDTEKRSERALQALQINERLAAELPEESNHHGGLHDALIQVGHTFVARGRTEEAASYYGRSLDVAKHIVAAFRDDEWRLAFSYRLVGGIQLTNGNLREAENNRRAAVDMYERLYAESNGDGDYLNALAGASFDLAEVYLSGEDFQRAREGFARCEEARTQLLKERPDDRDKHVGLTWCSSRIARVLEREGRYEEAMQREVDGRAVRADLVRQDPTNARWQRDLFWSHIRMGDIELLRGEHDAALRQFEIALAEVGKKPLTDGRNQLLKRERALLVQRIGEANARAGRHQQALSSLTSSLSALTQLAADDTANRVWQCDVARNLDRLGVLHSEHSDWPAASEHLSRSTVILDQLLQLYPSSPRWRHAAAVSMLHRGDVAAARADASAGGIYRQAGELLEALILEQPQNRSMALTRDAARRRLTALEAGSIDRTDRIVMRDCGNPLMWVVWR